MYQYCLSLTFIRSIAEIREATTYYYCHQLSHVVGRYTIIKQYAETIDKFTNFLEEELKGLKSLYFSISVTLTWLIVGEDVENSIEIAGILDYLDELTKKKNKKLPKIYEELKSDNFTKNCIKYFEYCRRPF